MKKNSFIAFLLIVSSLTIFSNFKVFKAYIGQEEIFNIITSSDYNMEEPFREQISSGYPSLSSTVIPFKSILGAHWIINDSIDKGLNLLREGQKDNPYLGFTDMLYAGLYEEVGMKDSFAHYARKAVSKLPNAPQHYILLVKTLLMEEKLDSLDIVFDNIKDNVNDPQLWQVYLAGAVDRIDKMDSLRVLENAKIAKSKYNYDDVRLLADYVIYGQDKIKSSIELKKTAIDTFPSNPKYSIEIMNDIIEDIPDDIYNYETLIEMYFRDNQFLKVTQLYENLIDKEMVNFNATIVEFVTISYINSKQLQFGCYLAQQLNSARYKLSSSVALACNISQ
jgi:predicted Zn-dependent protease